MKTTPPAIPDKAFQQLITYLEPAINKWAHNNGDISSLLETAKARLLEILPEDIQNQLKDNEDFDKLLFSKESKDILRAARSINTKWDIASSIYKPAAIGVGVVSAVPALVMAPILAIGPAIASVVILAAGVVCPPALIALPPVWLSYTLSVLPFAAPSLVVGGFLTLCCKFADKVKAKSINKANKQAAEKLANRLRDTVKKMEAMPHAETKAAKKEVERTKDQAISVSDDAYLKAKEEYSKAQKKATEAREEYDRLTQENAAPAARRAALERWQEARRAFKSLESPLRSGLKLVKKRLDALASGEIDESSLFSQQPSDKGASPSQRESEDMQKVNQFYHEELKTAHSPAEFKNLALELAPEWKADLENNGLSTTDATNNVMKSILDNVKGLLTKRQLEKELKAVLEPPQVQEPKSP